MRAAAAFASPATLAAAADAAAAQMYATHNSPALERHARLYAGLLARVLYGEDLRAAVAATARALGRDVAAWERAVPRGADDTRIVGGTVSSACYIDDSFPALLFLAYKYADDPEAALVANTNAGGENAHRGAALGALLGAARGAGAWPARWTDKLAEGRSIGHEAKRLADGAAAAFVGSLNAAAGVKG